GLLFESLLIALCIAVFGYSVYSIADQMIEAKRNNESYDLIRPVEIESAVKRATYAREPMQMLSMLETLAANGNNPSYKEEETDVDESVRRIYCFRNFKNFAAKNENAYAWIYIKYDVVDINYPVMKMHNDNGYYLKHRYDGVQSDSGSIFADGFMSDDYDANVNNLIYGHCMKNGSMFRTIKSLLESANASYVANHMNIEIYTEKGLYIYKVLSGYRDGTFFFTQTVFDSSEEYLEFLQKCVKHNWLGTSREYSADSRICTLVTCFNASNDSPERYVLQGILTNFIPASSL
ncbi:MAG: class B sortase, partial [Clostridia bacterium]|nr:class B sortase [Clostridia bacterium]